jgi:hypothetical protein
MCVQHRSDSHSESDYAMVTREFEDTVDEKILEGVRAAESQATAGKPADEQPAVATATPVVNEPQTAIV